MNDIIFSNSFEFHTITTDKYSETDNRGGAAYHYFGYMISGHSKLVTENETVEVCEGELFYIPDKCRYQSYWYGESEVKFISLGFSYLPNFENKLYPVQVIECDESEVEKMKYLADKNPLNAADVGVFYTLVGELLPKMRYLFSCRTREIVKKSKNYLIAHPNAGVAELAKCCAISEAALYAAFKKASGITPNTMKNQLLLEKAKNMLITTDSPIETMSSTLGFSSPSYFRKKFKDYFGITPREMRKKYRI